MERHTTRTFGIGDIRLTAFKWLIDPSIAHRGNIQLGMGIKLPTGDFRYQDYFYKKTGVVSAPVNTTIQLGDGGTGFTLELNGFYNVTRRVSLYGNLFYLLIHATKTVYPTLTVAGLHSGQKRWRNGEQRSRRIHSKNRCKL
jgi:hypothetical protein